MKQDKLARPFGHWACGRKRWRCQKADVAAAALWRTQSSVRCQVWMHAGGGGGLDPHLEGIHGTSVKVRTHTFTLMNFTCSASICLSTCRLICIQKRDDFITVNHVPQKPSHRVRCWRWKWQAGKIKMKKLGQVKILKRRRRHISRAPALDLGLICLTFSLFYIFFIVI